MVRSPLPDGYWSMTAEKVLGSLETNVSGLSQQEAEKRLSEYGENVLRTRKERNTLELFLAQFKSPIILLLLFTAALSFFLQDPTDALIIFLILFVSGILGFWQEHKASQSVEKLLEMVEVRSRILSEGKPEEVPVEQIVPGDIVLINAGDFIPGDCFILQSKDLFVDEAVLTGETFPVEKSTGVLSADTPLSKRTNVLYMGTHPQSGYGMAVVVKTGIETEFGKISRQLQLRPPETEFERGVRRFGYLLMEVTLFLVFIIFSINIFFSRPFFESFFFTLALAVGLTPQLLPAIISINLARGAQEMAKKKVVVKRLSSMENFGSMNILCSDKTGTLTEGKVRLELAVDSDGIPNEKLFRYAYINAVFESGFSNPIDDALRNSRMIDLTEVQKLDEIPYDFIRKRLSVLVSEKGESLLITKGSYSTILEICLSAERSNGTTVPIEEERGKIETQYTHASELGKRVLVVAYRKVEQKTSITRHDEQGMTFLGFLLFEDPPREHIQETIQRLHDRGVTLKVITGDNEKVATHIVQEIGFPQPRVMTGKDLTRMSDEALLHTVNEIDVFAEVDPNQKERIILSLRKAGNVVGYMGDGINDASALHIADVGISVEGAVAVAREAADIVLLEKDLAVLLTGIEEGRKTFANTLKYVFMATSANFGNMFSMAGGSLFLPFLPLLPGQILLLNLFTDFPEMTIATDQVDPSILMKPRKWDIAFIRRFMLTFGILSSAFDFLTFFVLRHFFHADTAIFRTGWFIESVISACLIALVIRTHQPFYQSQPSTTLLTANLLICGVTLFIPFTPLGRFFGFVSIPVWATFVLIGIVALYIASAEVVKHFFFRRER
ncbi:MAG: magnesium-translocating P-type ATPase [Candidatus Atribacteria bacterium]|nr:magnesium-translocating P-type ATPase [Candidatus Atribacteria bacterium]